MSLDSSSLGLDLQIHRTKLEAVITNDGAEPVRVWDRSNSWGWNTYTLEISGSSTQDIFALTAKPRAFTRNGPGFTAIPPGGSHCVTLATGDASEWDGLERIAHLRDDTLRVRAQLQIPPSPEADTYGVFVGTLSSPWQEVKPPHRWLFHDA